MIVSAVIAQRRDDGDSNLHYLDGLELFEEENAADLPDDLHPSGDGYVRMGERFTRRYSPERARSRCEPPLHQLHRHPEPPPGAQST